ncbi:MAG TPA: bidirectional hydrogenase complex protein HoxE [bacterium]|nr:bidirectional hydrogenase complex protein HoxE [bacterium]
MQYVEVKQPEVPSDDNRWKLLQGKMRRHGHGRSSLIEILHEVQEIFGYLDEQALEYVAASLHVPLSRVYGVATFYHFFDLKPRGEHTCVICNGTACHIKGSEKLIEKIEDIAGAEVGGTSPDGKVSLMTARCIGACSMAPAGVVDGEVKGHLDEESVEAMISEWRNDES